MDLRVDTPSSSDLTAIADLLEACHLPTDDLGEVSLGHFRVARHEAGGPVIGVVGLEVYGEVALLRSLAVSPDERGRSIGQALVGIIEAVADGAGVERLYLLTTTADRFFAARGYETAERAGAPPEIQRTSQFSGLCPDSAAFMSKPLRDVSRVR